MAPASPTDLGLPRPVLEIGKPHLQFTHARRTPRGESEDFIWLHERLDEDWVACYRLIPVDGRPVIGEAAVQPYDPAAKLPLPAGHLKALRTDAAADGARLVAEWFEDNPHADREFVRKIFGRFRVPRATDSRTTRRRLSDAELVRSVQTKIRFVEAGSTAPNQAAADELGLSYDGFAKRLHLARERGLSTGGGRGHGDIDLTKRGSRVAREAPTTASPPSAQSSTPIAS